MTPAYQVGSIVVVLMQQVSQMLECVLPGAMLCPLTIVPILIVEGTARQYSSKLRIVVLPRVQISNESCMAQWTASMA